MRARIEAAQKRRSRRRSRCICAWATLLAGLVTAGVLLREGSGPIVSISRAVHLQASEHLTWPQFRVSWFRSTDRVCHHGAHVIITSVS
jgi:hypothetical protein